MAGPAPSVPPEPHVGRPQRGSFDESLQAGSSVTSLAGLDVAVAGVTVAGVTVAAVTVVAAAGPAVGVAGFSGVAVDVDVDVEVEVDTVFVLSVVPVSAV